MGQQLSSESYCLATVQKLMCEFNTTDSQVSESHVTEDSCAGDDTCAAGADAVSGSGCSYSRIAFPWREWARVSKYLERVLPNSEQKRLLSHVLLDQTGLRCYQFLDADSAGDLDAAGSSGSGIFASSYGGPQPTSASRWSVHMNYGDESDKNAVLYRDFVKVHFQLDNVSPPQSASAEAVANGTGSYDSGLSSLSAASAALGSELLDRLTDLLKQHCEKISVGLVVTKAAYHSRDNCVVVSCTVDIRSILRNTGSLEVRSRVNYDVEDTELGDQLQRSLSGLRDKITNQQSLQLQLQQQQQQQQSMQPSQQQHPAYFPMLLYLCSSTNRVVLIYSRQQKVGQEGLAD